MQEALSDKRAPLAAAAVQAHLAKLTAEQQLSVAGAIIRQVPKVAGQRRAIATYAALARAPHSQDHRASARGALLALARDEERAKDVRTDAMDALAAADPVDTDLRGVYMAALEQCRGAEGAGRAAAVAVAEHCVQVACGGTDGFRLKVQSWTFG